MVGRNKKQDLKSFIIFLISIFSGFIIYHVIGLKLMDFKAGDVGLGIATTTHDAFFKNIQISQSHGNVNQILPAFRAFNNDSSKIILLTGNSQLHAINYYQNNDQLAVYYLNNHSNLDNKNFRFVQLSSPNINFIETLIYLLKVLDHQVKPDWLAIGATFSSFHFVTIRQRFLRNLSQIDLTKTSLSTEFLNFYRERIETYDESNSSKTMVVKYPQDKIEESLIQTIELFWPAYRFRGNVRSKIKILPGYYYQKFSSNNNYFFGSDFNINQNLKFLRQIIKICQIREIKVLIYRPPHPQSSEKFQYDRRKYDQLYSELIRISNETDHVFYEDYEGIVSLEFWGLNNRGWLDINHYKDQGHRLLAENIYSFFNRQYSEIQ